MELNFVNGKATLKQGRKTIAVVYHRPEYFKGQDIPYILRYPYGLQMSVGFRECETLDEVKELIKTYL